MISVMGYGFQGQGQLRIVLNNQLSDFSLLLASDFPEERKRQINSGRDSRSSPDLPVTNHSIVAHWCCAKPGELRLRCPMCCSLQSVKKARRSKNKCT